MVKLEGELALPATTRAGPAKQKSHKWKTAALLGAGIAACVLTVGPAGVCDAVKSATNTVATHCGGASAFARVSATGDIAGYCRNPDPVVPDGSSLDFMKSDEYRQRSLENLQALLRVPSISRDESGTPEEDPVWEVFDDIHRVIDEQYPLVKEHLDKEVVHKYALVYTWPGADASLKPVLLTAHLDVVPVPNNTLDKWTYPPFSAHFDGKHVWARGAADTKHSVTNVLDAIEDLLSQGYTPQRTVVAAFGFDEESSGRFGAKYIAEHLKNKYGATAATSDDKPFHSLVDEGGFGVIRMMGTNMAGISVAEKGRYGVQISLAMAGGHSSIPPDHTAVGVMGDVAHEIEASPYSPQLNEPFLKYLQCAAVYSHNMPDSLKAGIIRANQSDAARDQLVSVLRKDRQIRYIMQTSQSIDIVSGGEKINAIPELVTIAVDHRVAVHEDFDTIRNKLTDNVLAVAERYDLGVVSFGKELRKGANPAEYFELSQYVVTPIVPAPVTPWHTDAWNTFAGVVRHVYEDFGGEIYDLQTGESFPPETVVVSPSLHTPNTDTQYYWDLTDNIYRFTPLRPDEVPNYHTIDEHISLDAHIEGTAVYYEYLQVV